jgi:glycosyltransferase involved in cell wall biosynthesis
MRDSIPAATPPQDDRHEPPILSVIVPTRNEVGNIGPLLARLSAALENIMAEVVFVDDSTDRTPDVIAAEGPACPLSVRLIARPPNRRNGLSGAVVEGIEAARGTWVCVIDADLQHPPETIRQLLTQAERSNADLVVASRQADYLGPKGLSRLRAFTSQSLTILARMLFPRVLKNVSDPLTGFFLVRRAAVDTSLLQPTGFKILLELLVRHPDLHVTEIHFDFAPRHDGQSKADLHEGLRFFRHVTRLRLTVNQHLIRFMVLVMAAIGLNLALLWGMVSGAGWPVVRAAALAGALTIGFVLLGETWVFSDRLPGPTRRRLVLVVALGLLFLFLIYVPLIAVLVWTGVPYVLAAFLALLVGGFTYYLLSEQWIWTRGLMMRPRSAHTYDLHGILTIASQVPLDDLRAFETSGVEAHTDLQVRVDRHGTPTRVPGAIAYDEQLGRFGFGLTVLPGDFTEIVVSPLLETSPAFLFTNVVEPVLRWMLVTRGFALAHAGAVARTDSPAPAAVLFAGRPDLGYGLTRLCLEHGMAFLGDDRVILGRDQSVHAYPKPVTVSREMQRGDLPGPAAAGVAFALQRLLYSRPVRRLGLWLGHGMPAATLNTHLQRFIPQPKYPIADLAPEIRLAGRAVPSLVVLMEKGDDSAAHAEPREAAEILAGMRDAKAAFQPSPLLSDRLGNWDDRDWWAVERDILLAAVASARVVSWSSPADRWWERYGDLSPAPADAPAPSIPQKATAPPLAGQA